ILALVLACAARTAYAQAPEADFFSTSSKLNGALLPSGATIDAYDANGVHCGHAIAGADGAFLVHVSGDDPMTPGTDEGARDGEMLTWKVNGLAVENARWISSLI